MFPGNHACLAGVGRSCGSDPPTAGIHFPQYQDMAIILVVRSSLARSALDICACYQWRARVILKQAQYIWDRYNLARVSHALAGHEPQKFGPFRSRHEVIFNDSPKTG